MEYQFKGLRKSIYGAEPLRVTLANRLGLPEIERVVVEREAVDARRKPHIDYVYNVRFTVSRPSAHLRSLVQKKEVSLYQKRSLPEPEPRISLPERPIIIGFGPAGMFLGLHLARKGHRPIIYERGQPVAERVRSVARLWDEGILDPESNMQFGEGGAGTFSDGKLTTGKSSPLDRLILETFVRAGAPETILFESKPHIGTDYLRRLVVNLRKEIISLGGEVHFGQKLTDLHLRDDAVRGITVSGQRIVTSAAILAIGHSSRDTVRMLHRRGVVMEAKPFALGTRIEHPAELIDRSQYGAKGAEALPAADYKLTYRHRGLGVYTFCMCPGGQVVCASSEIEGQVTNGMSRHAREGAYSNSALVVSVDPTQQGLGDALETLAFQQELERAAYRAGGGGYVAPAQRATDFVVGRASSALSETTYRPGVTPVRLDRVLPPFVAEALRSGLGRFEHIIPGFVEEGILIGLESRTSSPLRILRDENCCSISTPGLYLLGEGAGYAGGIMTCARDALRFGRLVRPREH